MKYRDYDYGIAAVAGADGVQKFRWTIYENVESGHKTVGQKLYATHADAELACHKVIDKDLAAKKGSFSAHGP